MMLLPSIDALTIGNARRASTAAWVTKGREVSDMPYCAWKLPLLRARILATFVISTLWIVVTCGEVDLLRTMCSAMALRMVLSGSTRVLAIGSMGERGVTGAGVGAGAAGAGAGFRVA